ncbi:MAG: carboxypeptidase-like regulatory domain-containing protein, partial [Flavobacteriales bacterium]|nr:carboxypeptidase-like regulatory domain-containing protein [Flavobacteriales bacterium]
MQGPALWGQHTEIEGYIRHGTTDAPIAYATVYNRHLKQGTISNPDGYFSLKVSGPHDSVQVRFVGFRDYELSLSANVDFYTIHLEESALMLDEVTITPKDHSYLYDLMNACRKAASKTRAQARAYYALKSSISGVQVEMVEGYYNLDITGYSLDRTHLKAGRIGLQPHEGQFFFASLESSLAITMLDLLDKGAFFPENPLSMRKRKLKKSFLLDLESKYVTAENDSVYVIAYRPKDDPGHFFEGRVWLNKSEENLIKITLHCDTALRHPFLPIFPSDEVSSVSFRIAQTFSGRGEEAVFKHIDFDYEIA